MSDTFKLSASGDDGGQKRRGSIPHTAWPSILARHTAGETLAAIAADFGCTPSAIAYVVKQAKKEAAHAPLEEAADAAASARALAEQDDDADEEEDDGDQPAPIVPIATTVERVTRDPRPRDEFRRDERPRDEAPRRDDRPRDDRPRDDRRPDRPREDRFGDERPRDRPQPAQVAATAPRETLGRALPPERIRNTIGVSQQTAAPAAAETVEETDVRLARATEEILAAYTAWRRPGQGAAAAADRRTALAGSLHELRKVLARIEIELSASQAEDRRARPIPIPNHRAADRGRGGWGG